MAPLYINLVDAQTTLRPRIQVIAGALGKAVREWNAAGQYHALVDESFRGMFISQLWYTYVTQALRGDAGVMKHRSGNRPYFTFDQLLVLRFKHVDRGYQSWNHSTPEFRAWNEQASFPTIPPLPKLELGYRMDVTGTVVRDAMVMFKYKKQTLWRWQIWGRPFGEFATHSRDMFGRSVYAHDDNSQIVLP